MPGVTHFIAFGVLAVTRKSYYLATCRGGTALNCCRHCAQYYPTDGPE